MPSTTSTSTPTRPTTLSTLHQKIDSHTKLLCAKKAGLRLSRTDRRADVRVRAVCVYRMKMRLLHAPPPLRQDRVETRETIVRLEEAIDNSLGQIEVIDRQLEELAREFRRVYPVYKRGVGRMMR